MPLSFDSLEKAVELKKAGSQNGMRYQGRKHGRDETSEFYAESSYLLVSNSGTKISDQEQQRTGRWTEEEIAFVDFLVAAFDKGRLPLPHGIKLNEFLGDVLLCKSSRLTKKMKNAKLSTRSFVLSRPDSTSVRSDCAVLSGLQEKFLMSIPSKATQLELRFNMTKQWRTHFSNLCVQVGYQFLDGKDWVASLEEMERRASCVEENERKVRRRQMGLALQTDGIKADTASSQPELMPFNTEVEKRGRLLSTSEYDTDLQVNGGDFFPMLSTSLGGMSPLLQGQLDPRSRTFSEDFDAVLSDLIGSEQDAAPAPSNLQNQASSSRSPSPSHPSCGPFLDAVVAYMEKKNLPFQHVDVWVPSFLPRDTDGPSKAVDMEQLRLFNAGHSTRGDLDGSVTYALNEFGVYSENFSFEPGHGLPGRVYSTEKASWETYVDECDPSTFERAGGAKLHGVKTAFGVPLMTPMVGRIVVVLYSSSVLDENWPMAQECAAELVKLAPEPKWKIVIETNDSNVANGTTEKQNSSLNASAQRNQVSQQRNTTYFAHSQDAACAGGLKSEDEEQRIVSLLGEHMPLNESRAGEPSSSTTKSSELLPHFMAMRLTLLRPASRRSPQENEMIEILKNSFRAYSKDNRRSRSELAMLLAKDWVCLKSSIGSSLSPTQAQHQSPLDQPRRASSSASSTPSMQPEGKSSGSTSSEQRGQQILSYDHRQAPRRGSNFSETGSEQRGQQILSYDQRQAPGRGSNFSGTSSEHRGQQMVSYDHRPAPRRGSNYSEHSQGSRRMSFSESSSSGLVKPQPIRSANISVPNEAPIVTPTPNVIAEN
jgi:hypothetical protein